MPTSSSSAAGPRSQAFRLRSAPMIVDAAGDTVLPSSSNGLFCVGDGFIKSAYDPAEEPTSKVVLNAEVPFCAVVCGMPASGKTYTLAMLLGGLLSSTSSGHPRSALLCHLATPVSRASIPPCEVLSIMEANVLLPPACSHVVLAPPLHMADAANSYRSIPSAQVRPLRFAAKDITFDAALSLLGIGQDHPIFLDVLSTVDIFAEWDYKKFRKNILMVDSHPGHVVKLQKRLSVLDACIVDEDDGFVSEHFKEGSLSVVDLSYLHGDADLASAIFEHTIRTYMATGPARKILAIDSSDKLLAAKSGGHSLFAAVSSLIQDQRSHNMQVLLSLQDPTSMPSDIFARSAVTIIHRLWSPVWLEHLGRNIGLLDRHLDGISCLETGDAIIMAPAAMQLVAQVDSERTSADEVELVRLGNEPLQVRLRSLCCPPGDATPLVYSPAFGSAVGQNSKAPDIASSDLLAPTVDRAHEETADAVPKLPSDGKLNPSLNHQGPMLSTESHSGSGTASPTGSPSLRSSVRAAESPIGEVTVLHPLEATLPDSGVVENAQDALSGFQPLIDTLLHVKGSVHIDVLFYNLRSRPGVPREMLPFKQWIQQAEMSGKLFVRDGNEIFPSIPSSREFLSAERTSISQAQSSSSPSSPSSSGTTLALGGTTSATVRPSSPSPAISGVASATPIAFELTKMDKAYLGTHALLIQHLCQQRAEGKAELKCSDVSGWLRRQGPSWLTKSWKLREYLADAARRGLVAVDYPSTHPDGSVRLSEGWRFHPLRALCTGQARVNLSVVANDLKASHPGLIPSGAGKVRAYMDDAVAAGVVVFLDHQREWFRLDA